MNVDSLFDHDPAGTQPLEQARERAAGDRGAEHRLERATGRASVAQQLLCANIDTALIRIMNSYSTRGKPK